MSAKKKSEEEFDEVIYVRCEECGHEQPDMGHRVNCEECGHGPMPTSDIRALLAPKAGGGK